MISYEDIVSKCQTAFPIISYGSSFQMLSSLKNLITTPDGFHCFMDFTISWISPSH